MAGSLAPGFNGVTRHLPLTELELLEQDLLELVVSVHKVTAFDVQRANEEARALSGRMQAFHLEHDLLVTPPACAAGPNTPDAKAYPSWLDWTQFTWPFNLSRQPAASIPCGFTAAGLPIGLQIVGPMFREGLILCAGQVIKERVPPLMPPLLDRGRERGECLLRALSCSRGSSTIG